jgi:hypothetical protein
VPDTDPHRLRGAAEAYVFCDAKRGVDPEPDLDRRLERA